MYIKGFIILLYCVLGLCRRNATGSQRSFGLPVLKNAPPIAGTHANKQFKKNPEVKEIQPKNNHQWRYNDDARFFARSSLVSFLNAEQNAENKNVPEVQDDPEKPSDNISVSKLKQTLPQSAPRIVISTVSPSTMKCTNCKGNNSDKSVISTQTTKPNSEGFRGFGVSVLKKNTSILYPQWQNVSNNSSNETAFSMDDRLCGYPIYSERKACSNLNCRSDPLYLCQHTWGTVIFGAIVGILSLCIIGLNGIIPIVVYRNPKMRTQYDYIKVSLAVADMLVGVLMFVTVLPNIAWFRNMTEQEAIYYIYDDNNSARAVVVGSLLTVSKQASLLHLSFLSLERFVAIKWSFWHIKRRTKTVAITLVAIWITSVILCFIPAAYPDAFEYTFQPSLLMHMLTLKERDDINWHGPLYGAISILLPYTITVLFCILTGIVSYNKLKAARQIFGEYDTSKRNGTNPAISSYNTVELNSPRRKAAAKRLQPEISVFITIIIMISAFTITLLPFAVVLNLFMADVLDCDNYTYPYVLSFYVGMINSLANGLIYSARDKGFRAAVRELLLSRCCSDKSTQAYAC